MRQRPYGATGLKERNGQQDPVITFGRALSLVTTGTVCPRCGSSAFDVTVDISKSPILSAIQRDKVDSSANLGCGACLSVFLLGIPMLIYALGRLITLPERRAREKERVAEEERCSRFTCRACNLIWYPDEWEDLHKSTRQD